MRAGIGSLVVVAVVALMAAGAPAKTKPPSATKRAAAAAKAAGCVLRTFPEQGREHTDGTVTYATNPPTSGPHNPEPAEDGIYAPGASPQVEKTVHALEHGRVLIQFRPGTSQRRIDALTKVYMAPFHGRPGYHLLLFQNTTQMPYAVAATAWRRLLGCRTFNARTTDAVRAFRAAYVDHAPESIP